jgi:long-chain acyl-CoA synthetase
MGCEKLKNIVFITGATGFLGTQIIRRLIKIENICIIVLVRGKNFEDSFKHLSRAWWEWPELKEEINDLKCLNTMSSLNKINLLKGDLSEEKLGLTFSEYNYLVNNLTHIIHTAADIRLNAPLQDLRKINVDGTRNLLKLAREAHKDHGISRFSHLSTAYVAGGSNGIIYEDSITDKYGFQSNYEKSKYESELIVRASDLPISIFRPGMIVGDSNSGHIKTFNTIYVLIRLYLDKKLSVLPVSGNTKINLVPVDYVVDAIVNLTFNPKTEGLTFHVTAPYADLPNIKEFIDFIQQWANKHLELKISKPIFLSSVMIPYVTNFLKVSGKSGRRVGKTLTELSSYMNENREFSRSNIEKFLGPYNLNWQKFLPKLLNYGVYNGFFHRSERTVHEQVLFRLNSKNRPITFYDVNNKYLKIKSSNIRIDIINAIKALKALNIRPGDRIAIVGYNTTRYLTLDVSIGLLGAVSVPIYYTSPISEIKEILNDCGAKAIFIGSPYLLKQLTEHENIKTISFCKDSIEVPLDILSWNEFLTIGRETEKTCENNTVAPVNFDDIATIRYTSGTTGKPSGVIFTHGNLRWMAEYTASMPPWKDRTAKITYLSFLPMNHVIEGILGIYAPYYAPASLNLYFLEDFKKIERTLPQVKPTIFFSVPRFYEKLWSKIQQSFIGNLYLNTQNGPIRNILRRILRRSILKQTGLDLCAQLIVGSAPISIDLLKSFRELGIEIYNAYGLTEAPIVTINKRGFNRLGTVGEPIPHTDVKILDDGEVIVRGPQVTPGYFNDEGRNDSNFLGEWLLTGDYGKLTSDHNLVITGRKKELIVNSYGKTISPIKIEGMLRHINRISEVMVVGDEKPYCISLIWINDHNNINIEELSLAIQNVNSKLSNPEKIKRWAILENDLSIENGDLTANLKLKRENILKHYQNLVNLIYDNNFPNKIKKESLALNVIHLGENNEY